MWHTKSPELPTNMFVGTIQHQSQGVQVHVHGDLDQVGERDDKVKFVAAESK